MRSRRRAARRRRAGSGELLGDLGVGGGPGDGVEGVGLGVAEALHELLGGAGGDEAVVRAACRRVGGEVVGISVARSLPERTRTPQPRLIPCEADLTRDSSMPREVEVTDSKSRSVAVAPGESFGEAALNEALGDAELHSDTTCGSGAGMVILF